MVTATLVDEELWEACRAGDAGARGRLIERHLPLAHMVAKRHRGLLFDDSLDQPDLAAYGYLGLVDAVDTFDPERGFAFSTYAVTVIRHRIFKELRRLKPPTWGREGNRNGPALLSVLSLDAPRSNDPDSDPLLDSIACPEPGPEERAENSDMAEQVRQALRELDPRQQKVLYLYYYQELNFDDIGSVFGVSKARAAKIRDRALERLRETLQQQLALA